MAGRLPDPTRFLDLPEVRLERGGVLRGVRVAYRTWGRLSASRDNAVVACHALTGSPDVDAWWPGLLGPGRALDPDRDFVVCSNVLGGCYGTTGPSDPDPATGAPYGPGFPDLTIRDLVAVQVRLADHLGIGRVACVVGGSLGGMQVLEWGFLAPGRVRSLVPIAVSGRHSAWCIGLSEAQRAAIEADPRWRGGRYPADDPPVAGLAAARMAAMVSYRSRESLEARFGRQPQPGDPGRFAVEGYLAYQGRKLVGRFDARTYHALTRAMDTHDVARGRGDYEAVLQGLDVPALVVSIPTDLLYFPAEQEELARLLPRAELYRLASPHGHDAFLIETDALSDAVREFRARLHSDEAGTTGLVKAASDASPTPGPPDVGRRTSDVAPRDGGSS